MLQLELGEDIETRIAEKADALGISVNDFVRNQFALYLAPMRRKTTLAEREAAARELATFAKDRGIDLPIGVTIKSLLEEVRR
jgi:uncharacterized protein YgfB (UPF0149 family)